MMYLTLVNQYKTIFGTTGNTSLDMILCVTVCLTMIIILYRCLNNIFKQ